ncbi:MAG TPA: substrate-binding domain-containing protein, partial [Asticcacaulis sp.]|nr:substrate-binding domain-containing protein [Asticcacaulis sp.]
FLQLGEAWADIESDHIDPVECVARVEDDVSGWIVTRGGGRTLQDLLENGGTLDAAAVRQLARGLSQGLGDLHGASLCHLNLSPGAILLPDENAPETCRLTGLAPDERAYAKIFKSTKTLGEPGFSPPELQDGSAKSKLGPATDIYGASAVLYRLIAGRTLPDWRQTADYEQAVDALNGGDAYPAAFIDALKLGLALDYQTRADKAAPWHRTMENAGAKKTSAKKRAADASLAVPAEPETPKPETPAIEPDAVLLPDVIKTDPEPDVRDDNRFGQGGQNDFGQRKTPPPTLPPALIGLAIGVAAILLLLGGWLAVKSLFFKAPHYDLVLSGSSSVGEKLAPELVKAWLQSTGYDDIKSKEHKVSVKDPATGKTEDHPEFDISGKKDGKTYRVGIRAAGTGTGFKEAQTEGAVDIVMASRQIKSDEINDLKPRGDFGGAAAEHVVSYDGIAVIVAQGNPVSRLTVTQLHDIFTGRITDWGEVGGASGHHIDLYSRDSNSGTYDGFKSKVLGSDPMADAKTFSAGGELESAVASDPDAIGFVAMSAVKTTTPVAISAVGGNYFAPTSFTVRSERYPLYRKLYLYAAPQAAKPEAAAFLQFAESEAGQAIPPKVGQVSLSLMQPTPDDGGGTQANMGNCQLSFFWNDPNAYCELIQHSQALPLTITFRSGSFEPENRTDVDTRLIGLLEANPDKTVVLVGHSDNQGDYGDNVRLSERRAAAVKEELATHGWTRVQTYGFGPDIPHASNDSDAGRHDNRRVEVYLQ